MTAPSYYSSQQKDFECHRSRVILNLHLHVLLSLLFRPPLQNMMQKYTKMAAFSTVW